MAGPPLYAVMTSAGTGALCVDTGCAVKTAAAITPALTAPATTRFVMPSCSWGKWGRTPDPLVSVGVLWIGPVRHGHLHRAPRALDAVLQVLLERLVFRAFGAQRVGQAVVALMALVGQEHAAVERRQRHRHRERRDVGHRVIHRELVLQDVVGHA